MGVHGRFDKGEKRKGCQLLKAQFLDCTLPNRLIASITRCMLVVTFPNSAWQDTLLV